MASILSGVKEAIMKDFLHKKNAQASDYLEMLMSQQKAYLADQVSKKKAPILNELKPDSWGGTISYSGGVAAGTSAPSYLPVEPKRLYLWTNVGNPNQHLGPSETALMYFDLPPGASFHPGLNSGDYLLSITLGDGTQLLVQKHKIAGMATPSTHAMFCQLNGWKLHEVKLAPSAQAPCKTKEVPSEPA